MPLRFFRRVRIAPGVTVNLSKSGPSLSLGPKGAKVTLGHGRVRRTVGLPGSGLYYTTTSKIAAAPGGRKRERPTAVEPLQEDQPTRPAASAGGVAGFWGRRSTAGKAAIVSGLLLAAYLLGASSRPATVAVPNPPSAAVGLVGAMSSPESRSPLAAATAPPTSSVVPTNSPSPKPKATPRPTPRPTSAPTATPLSVHLVSLTSPIHHGARASLTIRTAPAAHCSIEVDYASGPSTAAGLDSKKASSTGSVSWTWVIGTNTTPGRWPIQVDCSKGGRSKEFSTAITVR